MYVRGIYNLLETADGQTELIKLIWIRKNKNLIVFISTHIHHRYLLLLFQTLTDHILSETAHTRKGLV